MAATTKTRYEIVMGLEIHVQLKTETKLFCSCATSFGASPNLNTCPVCLGMPGVLPVLNKKAVEYAIRAGLALNCSIAEVTKFDRKQYFYPDLPKAYQISQYDLPICADGFLMVQGKRIGIERAHLEEDAGKLVHAGADGLAGSTHSLVDLNRAGTPLLEVVSRPDLRTPEEARAYGETMRHMMVYLGVCDGNLEEGSMRIDVNISVRPVGREAFGTKVELKNMNSFRAIERAIDYETLRQTDLVESGGQVVQESRLWNEATNMTVSMRSKEDAHDYRYFPDPDLRPLEISRQWVEEIRANRPELPEERLSRYQNELGLSEYDALVLVEFKEMGDFLDATRAYTPNVKLISNWLMGDVTGYLKNHALSLETTKLTPALLGELIAMIDDNTISSAIAKKILPDILETGTSPKTLVEEKGLAQITDDSQIEAFCQQAIDNNPNQVSEYRAGKDKLFGFFVGQVMKLSQGKANPDRINDIILKLLKGDA
jgi:aspartyl-tRNA(Asn)/glutamyl-tRNA(Gln) amidotransferase subunit B